MNEIIDKITEIIDSYETVTGFTAALTMHDFLEVRKAALEELGARCTARQKTTAPAKQQRQAPVLTEPEPARSKPPAKKKETPEVQHRTYETEAEEDAPERSAFDILKSLPDPWNN